MDEIELDARGLLCPLPVLKAGKRLRAMRSGAVLRLLASDPMAVIDVPQLLSRAGPRAFGERGNRRPSCFQDQAQMSYDFGRLQQLGRAQEGRDPHARCGLRLAGARRCRNGKASTSIQRPISPRRSREYEPCPGGPCGRRRRSHQPAGRRWSHARQPLYA